MPGFLIVPPPPPKVGTIGRYFRSRWDEIKDRTFKDNLVTGVYEKDRN